MLRATTGSGSESEVDQTPHPALSPLSPWMDRGKLSPHQVTLRSQGGASVEEANIVQDIYVQCLTFNQKIPGKPRNRIKRGENPKLEIDMLIAQYWNYKTYEEFVILAQGI